MSRRVVRSATLCVLATGLLGSLASIEVHAAEAEEAGSPQTQASGTFRSVFTPFETPSPATYDGDFSRRPVPHWMHELPGGSLNAAAHTEHTRPVIHGGSVFVGAAAGEALYELSRRDGALIRSFEAAAAVESEALVLGDRVYFADTSGRLWCYGLDGTLQWSRETGAPALVRPTVHEGRVYLTNVDDLVVAFDADTGDLAWRHQRKADVSRTAELALYAAPPAKIIGDDVLVGFSDGSLTALSAEGGDPRWTVRVGEGRYPDLIAEPTRQGDLLYVSGYFRPLVALDAETRDVVWTLPHGSAGSAVLYGEGESQLLIHPGTDGVLRGIEPRTGDVRWEWSSETDGSLTEPVLTPAGVIVASSAGGVSMVDPATGARLWTFRPPFLLEGVTAAPVVRGRQLLFTTNAGRLYSLLSPQPERTWPPTDD